MSNANQFYIDHWEILKRNEEFREDFKKSKKTHPELHIRKDALKEEWIHRKWGLNNARPLPDPDGEFPGAGYFKSVRMGLSKLKAHSFQTVLEY